MNKVVLIVVVCVALQVSLALAGGRRFKNTEYESGFSDWTRKNAKAYSSSDFLLKFLTFMDNMDFVDEWNSQNKSFTVGLNDYADLSSEEFAALLLRPWAPRSARELGIPEFSGEGMHIPRANVDWRDSGAVTPVKNQGSCGSCWTFSTAGGIESIYQLTTGTLTSLSEQNLLDCVTEGNGCNGGSPYYAYNYVKNNGGIATMASYPYEGAKTTCRYSSATKGADISGVTRVKATEADLLAAVSKQPVSVAIQAGLQSFQLYKSGTYSDAACGTALDHAVIAVGYGNDANGDYWLVKNSWGTSWGDKGYVKIARGNNMCGISNECYIPTRATTTTGTATTTAAPATTSTTAKSSTTSTTAKSTTTSTTAKSTTTSTTAKSTTTSTTAKSTTGSTSTTAKSTTGSTTGSVTTGSGTTTGGAVSGVVYTDAVAAGWTLTSSGTVSGLNTCGATSYGTCGVVAVIGASGKLVFTRSSALATTSFTKINFVVKASAAGTVLVDFGGNYKLTASVSTTFKSYSAPLSSLGSPASVSVVNFQNYGTGSATFTFDNISFA